MLEKSVIVSFCSYNNSVFLDFVRLFSFSITLEHQKVKIKYLDTIFIKNFLIKDTIKMTMDVEASFYKAHYKDFSVELHSKVFLILNVTDLKISTNKSI